MNYSWILFCGVLSKLVLTIHRGQIMTTKKGICILALAFVVFVSAVFSGVADELLIGQQIDSEITDSEVMAPEESNAKGFVFAAPWRVESSNTDIPILSIH